MSFALHEAQAFHYPRRKRLAVIAFLKMKIYAELLEDRNLERLDKLNQCSVRIFDISEMSVRLDRKSVV